MQRIETLFFVGALASALWLGACGDDEVTCEDFCDARADCGENRRECVSDCKSTNPPEEFLSCGMGLSCDATEDEIFECVRKIPANEACSEGCKKLVACLEDGPDPEEAWMLDVRTCASVCTWYFSPERQQCMAEMDEECRVSEECSQHF